MRRMQSLQRSLDEEMRRHAEREREMLQADDPTHDPTRHPVRPSPAPPARQATGEEEPYIPTTPEWRALLNMRAELAARLGKRPEELTRLYATIDRISASTPRRRWRPRGTGVEAVVAMEDGAQLVAFAGSEEACVPRLQAGECLIFLRSEPHRKPSTPEGKAWQTSFEFLVPGPADDAAASVPTPSPTERSAEAGPSGSAGRPGEGAPLPLGRGRKRVSFRPS